MVQHDPGGFRCFSDRLSVRDHRLRDHWVRNTEARRSGLGPRPFGYGSFGVAQVRPVRAATDIDP